MIEVKDLSFGFSNRRVLRNVSFSVQEGEFVALFGPNGGGKTTLCKLLVGLLKRQSGLISMPKEVAYVPQNFAADPLFPISVLEVVLMGRLSSALFGYSKEDRAQALLALKRVGMEAYVNTAFSALSGGQRQRVLVARALVSHPKILILDEALANVDTLSAHSLLELLKSLDLTILMVTHDLPSAVENCDRLICINGTSQEMEKSQLCHHFESGLYHGVGV
ncbi:MAG: Manganese transport system ATP-binding protein MntB [Chlamydiales bacterium]|nr:Manganese transport system ATP-binding protein MntB [Chlamydiales bacterium]MCH9635639.1 Manganese transport system ATP-binding protein MntB [Chlamydiales bacterium]